MTASCPNSECPEFGIPKDASMVPEDYLPLLCGGCGAECVPDPTPEE